MPGPSGWRSLEMKVRMLLVVLLILLAGCAYLVPRKAPGPPLTEAELRKGTQGLLMVWIPGAPPATVYESPPDRPGEGLFEIALELKNLGASDIESGWLTLLYEAGRVLEIPGEGWKLDNVPTGITERSLSFSLEGRSLANPSGGRVLLSRMLKTGLLEPLSLQQPSSIGIIACYDYSTLTSATICIDPDPAGLRGITKTCRVADVSLTDQGAPLAITKIEVAMLPRGLDAVLPELKVHIANKGKGSVLNIEALEAACKGQPAEIEELYNVLELGGSLAELELVCTPSPVRLRDNVAVVRCVTARELRPSMAYPSPVSLVARYGYSQASSRTITIMNNPGLEDARFK